MAGSISLSLSQQFDSTGAPLAGGFLYLYAAGTTTPQSAYQDVALTIPYPNPIELDSAGRIPAFYLADGQIKIRLTDENLVTQVSADNLLVVGASSGAGSPPSVDATTVADTGDIKTRYDTASISGWVRLNGRTIGSATSGGTERANADCEELFVHLWNIDASLAVSTGRGANAAADWAANKNIALPDFAGRVQAGFDDMGAGPAGRLTIATMTGTGIGSVSTADEEATLITANLPAYTPSGTIGITGGTQGGSFAGGSIAQGGSDFNAVRQSTAIAASFTGTAQGGTSTPFSIVQPTICVTVYCKL